MNDSANRRAARPIVPYARVRCLLLELSPAPLPEPAKFLVDFLDSLQVAEPLSPALSTEKYPALIHK